MYYRNMLFSLIFIVAALSTNLSVAVQPGSSVNTKHASDQEAKQDDASNEDPLHLQRIEQLRKNIASEGYDISSLLTDERFQLYENIDDFFTQSAERKSVDLQTYKRILGFKAKKRRGNVFLNEYKTMLEIAEAEYNISKFVIAAILGIESDFGKNVGSYNPFNTFVSMFAVDYRADFAKAQLLELLAFTQRNQIDILELKSSYAGAVSFAQFIPYSLNKWFVGNDITSMENNIMSVANYLAYFEKRTKTLRTSILRYNPSGMYADAVLELANELEKSYGES